MNIFTYGSLMVPSIFVSVTGRNFNSRRARLADYQRFCLKHDTYPGIVEADGESTDGMIYFDIDALSLRKLDAFEGEYYQRKTVYVTLDDQRVIDAETYVIKPEYLHILSDRAWDFDEFRNRFQDAFTQKYCGFSSIDHKSSGP